jgi:polysaccharide deacetylase family protein (PEP-CTERM system associated)
VSDAIFLASFDVEEWFHAENLKGALPTDDWDRLESRVERNTHELLDALAAAGVKATCFVLGWVARRYPALVRRMVAEGHEVASHSDTHRRLYSLSRAELAADLGRARDTLEQIAGARVWGIRAPMFSISDAVLDYLAETEYWYDSSFYDFKAHDRYGQLATPINPERAVVEVRPGLLELPMSRVPFGPLTVPWSGGGYFRLIPAGVYRWGVRRRLARRDWFMFYFHPWELDAEEPRPPGLSLSMRFRAYVGRGRMRQDLRSLLRDFGSARIDQTLMRLGFTPPGWAPSDVA